MVYWVEIVLEMLVFIVKCYVIMVINYIMMFWVYIVIRIDDGL